MMNINSHKNVKLLTNFCCVIIVIVMKTKTKQMFLSESDVLSSVRDYLHLEGYYVIRHQQGLGSHIGHSDLTAVRDGECLWIETKAEKFGKQSDGQIKFQKQIEDHGGIYLLINHVDRLMDWMENNNRNKVKRLFS